MSRRRSPRSARISGEGKTADNPRPRPTQAGGETMMTATEELCRQLTESITALANTAQELQLVSTTSSRHPQTSKKEDDEAVRRRLDASLTAVEEQARALTVSVQQEQSALQQVQEQHELAQRHHQYLLTLQQEHVAQSTNNNSNSSSDDKPMPNHAGTSYSGWKKDGEEGAESKVGNFSYSSSPRLPLSTSKTQQQQQRAPASSSPCAVVGRPTHRLAAANRTSVARPHKRGRTGADSPHDPRSHFLVGLERCARRDCGPLSPQSGSETGSRSGDPKETMDEHHQHPRK